uniref:Uncharacterized protein n=1 Tax=Acrobeloides nanus TaxID=290746 RepID=A0A914E4P3_9BILA
MLLSELFNFVFIFVCVYPIQTACAPYDKVANVTTARPEIHNPFAYYYILIAVIIVALIVIMLAILYFVLDL